MSGVLATFVFYAKVVGNKSGLDWFYLVYPEAGYQFVLVAPVLVQTLLEQLIC